MKKILALCLAAMLLLALCACGEDKTDPTTVPSTTAATTTVPTTAPPTVTTTLPTTAPTIQPTTAPTTAPTTNPAEQEALRIASELLGKYNWYGAVGACCDMEYVEGDMSAYLSDAQKDIYVGSQQRITCCKNEEEVIGHLHQTFSDRLITSYPEDLLFTDDDVNLYIIIYPTGLPYYKDHRLISYNENFIDLEADCYEEDQREGTARITCARTFDGFILEEFEYTSAHPEGLTEEGAKQVATRLLESYAWYRAIGVGCDTEYVEGDMSAYLSDAQKGTYIGHQRMILCCYSAAEVNEHIDRSFVPELLIRGYPDDLLFSDDEGNLYVMIVPSEVAGYRNHRVVFFDDDTIVMEAEDWYDGLDGTARVVCTRTADGFILEQFVYTPEQ